MGALDLNTLEQDKVLPEGKLDRAFWGNVQRARKPEIVGSMSGILPSMGKFRPFSEDFVFGGSAPMAAAFSKHL